MASSLTRALYNLPGGTGEYVLSYPALELDGASYRIQGEQIKKVFLRWSSPSSHLTTGYFLGTSVKMITFVITVLLVAQASARPPTRNQAVPQPNSPEVKAEGNEAWDLGVDYNRYLQEVVQVLESDPDFRKKLETSDVEKIRDGSIAQELEFVHHNLRTKLDNVKRKEIDRYLRTTQVVA